MHALFEQVKWLDDARPEPAQLQRAAESVITVGLDIETQLAAFQEMLDRPEINAVLRRAFYAQPTDKGLQQALAAAGAAGPVRAEAHNERRFAVLDNGRVLSGSIDRLVLLYAGDRLVTADVVDYKTDAIDPDHPDQLDESVEFYRPQLDAYRRAVSAMYHLPVGQICARLLFVSAGVMRPMGRETG